VSPPLSQGPWGRKNSAGRGIGDHDLKSADGGRRSQKGSWKKDEGKARDALYRTFGKEEKTPHKKACPEERKKKY